MRLGRARDAAGSRVPAPRFTQSRTILVHDLSAGGPVRRSRPPAAVPARRVKTSRNCSPPVAASRGAALHAVHRHHEQRCHRELRGPHRPRRIDLLAASRSLAGGLAGVAQSSPHAKDGWELAFSTAPAFQRQGVATMLGRWLLAHLASRGGREAYIYCAPKNIAMRGLARKLAFDLHIEGGEVVANRRLAAPTSPPRPQLALPLLTWYRIATHRPRDGPAAGRAA
ncbi:MAG: GNAT family N-acetyltransferase [Chromatiales bacterium]|nr:GNAT family N-acetyltransferase [Chromatiales bacterium]